MRSTLALAVLLAAPWPALAQTDNPIVIPPAPPIVSAPLTPASPPAPVLAAPPPGLVETPVPPPDADNGAPPVAAQTPPQVTVPDTPPAPSNDWVAGNTASLGLLNKVDGSVAQLQVPVGGATTFGDLRINVLACAARPPDQVPDATIFVSINTTADLSGPPLYRGWLLRSIPGAAVVGDASATLRVVNCS